LTGPNKEEQRTLFTMDYMKAFGLSLSSVTGIFFTNCIIFEHIQSHLICAIIFSISSLMSTHVNQTQFVFENLAD